MTTLLDKLRVRMTADEINSLPLVFYRGPVTVIRSEDVLAKHIDYLNAETVLGFDTEARPTRHKGEVHRASLIQLATAERVYLIQLSWFPLSSMITDLLSNPSIIKVGVAVGDDMKELAQLRPFTPAGVVDLGVRARALDLWSQGLRPLTANLFHERISKKEQCSDWSRKRLSASQVTYAATDAWIGRRLYLRMQSLGLLE